MRARKKILIVATIALLIILISVSSRADIINPSVVSKPSEDPGFYRIGGTIVSFIRGVGTIVSVVTLAIMGIKYMVGSVDEKAEYKKEMVPYLIGAVLVFGLSNLITPLYEIFYN